MLLNRGPNCRFASQVGSVAQRGWSIANNPSSSGNHQQTQLGGETQ